jgi:ATP-dependent DNA helicase RecG
MEKLSDINIRYIKGIGPQRAKAFAKYGVENAEDLLYYFPRRYEDRSNFVRIRDLGQGQSQTIKANVLVSGERRSWRRRGFSITEAVVEDDSGRISCIWFNQPYLKQYLKPTVELILYGKVESYAGKLQMSNPEFELVSREADEPDSSKERLGESLNIGRIVSIYPAVEGMGQRTLRRLIRQTIDKYIGKLSEFLPYDIRLRNNLLNLAQSLINIHFPQDAERQKEAYRRLAFEEFFLFQLPLALRKLKRKEKPGIAHKVEGRLVESFIEHLAFKLTDSQIKVIGEIKQDMASSQAMQRLLQGDVGSGKTVVATVAALSAVQGGYQAAFMAPTEILAKQHYEKISYQLSALPVRQAGVSCQLKPIKIGLLTSSIDKKEKEVILKEIRQGKIDLVIGTHALLQEEVQFKNLGLVIIDEQHKFGVGQRALLPQKGSNPDVLIMTATPIPRTLAITLYGDLDVSVINELPPGRKPIQTQWITSSKRDWFYGFIKEKVLSGRQVYIVYPLIEESYALDLLSAKKMYAEFKNNLFKDFQVGLIHGKLKQKEQDRMMSGFNRGKLQILIATTILEVGIDVANASVMVIEHAERFGLSQLHQLRGRIGRGKDQSFCILISDADSLEAKARIEAMVNYSDGFRIAEEDLKIRGPGEYFGSRQHGLTGLKLANPLTQMQLLKRAREEAIKLVDRDPRFEAKPNLLLKDKLLQRFPEYEKLMLVG